LSVSETRDRQRRASNVAPDFAALNPGYAAVGRGPMQLPADRV